MAQWLSQTRKLNNHYQSTGQKGGTVVLPNLPLGMIERNGVKYYFPYVLTEHGSQLYTTTSNGVTTQHGWYTSLNLYSLMQSMTPIASGKFTYTDNSETVWYYYRAIYQIDDEQPRAGYVTTANGAYNWFNYLMKYNGTRWVQSDVENISIGASENETGHYLVPKYHRYYTLNIRTSNDTLAPDFVKDFPDIEASYTGHYTYLGTLTLSQCVHPGAVMALKPELLDVKLKVNKSDKLYTIYSNQQAGSTNAIVGLYQNNLRNQLGENATIYTTDYNTNINTFHQGYNLHDIFYGFVVQYPVHTCLGYDYGAVTIYEGATGTDVVSPSSVAMSFSNTSNIRVTGNPRSATYRLSGSESSDNIITFGEQRVIYDLAFFDNVNPFLNRN